MCSREQLSLSYSSCLLAPALLKEPAHRGVYHAVVTLTYSPLTFCPTWLSTNRPRTKVECGVGNDVQWEAHRCRVYVLRSHFLSALYQGRLYTHLDSDTEVASPYIEPHNSVHCYKSQSGREIENGLFGAALI